MVAINVRALILAFTFGICIAGDIKMPNSKCIIGEENKQPVFEEVKKNYTECLEKVKPGADPQLAHKEPNYLITEENDELLVCMNMKKGVVSEDRVYLVDMAVNSIMLFDAAEQGIKDSLVTGIKNCAEGMDTTADCVKIVKCVNELVQEICLDRKTSDKEE